MTVFIQHISRGERWDLLAYQYYGDANRTGPIIRGNRGLFEDAIPAILPVGLTLRIPVLDPAPVAPNDLPPWKRNA